MAFTDSQKDSILEHLNYPVTSWARAFISDRCNTISSLSSVAETRIVAYIADLDAVDTARDSYISTNAGVQVKTDGSVMFQSSAIAEYNRQYSHYQNKLATALDIPIYTARNSFNNRLFKS
jgi:hypothetical protein